MVATAKKLTIKDVYAAVGPVLLGLVLYGDRTEEGNEGLSIIRALGDAILAEHGSPVSSDQVIGPQTEGAFARYTEWVVSS
jgi:hypothetical protein